MYAAYGGIFIALALGWGVVVDGFQPDRWDMLGAAICVTGVVVMVAPPRGVKRRYSPECVEKLFGNTQAPTNRLTIKRIMAAYR